MSKLSKKSPEDIELLKLEKEIKENELLLFQSQIFKDINKDSPNADLFKVIQNFMKLFDYNFEEGLAKEENEYLKEEIAISSRLIGKYEKEYTALIKKFEEFQKKFEAVELLKETLKREKENLEKDNKRLFALEDKYKVKVKEEFTQKLLQFKVEEYTFYSSLLQKQNQKFQGFLSKVGRTLNLNYFIEFLFPLKKTITAMKIMFSELKDEKEVMFYLGYYLYCLKMFELNIKAADFEAKVLKKPINKEIFLKLIEDGDILFTTFKERKEKIETPKLKLFYYSLHRFKKIFYPDETDSLTPPSTSQDGETVVSEVEIDYSKTIPKENQRIVSLKMLKHLTGSISIFKNNFNSDSVKTFNSFKNIIELFTGILDRQILEVEKSKKRKALIARKKKKKVLKYFIMPDHRLLQELFFYLEESRKYKIITNTKNNSFFNLLYLVKKGKCLAIYEDKMPDLEYKSFSKDYENLLSDSKALEEVKKKLIEKENDVSEMNKMVNKLKLEKKEINKKLSAATYEVEMRKKKEEEKLRSLTQELETIKEREKDEIMKKKEKIHRLKSRIQELSLMESLCEKYRKRIVKLREKKSSASLQMDSMATMNLNKDVYLNLLKRLSWLQQKENERDIDEELKWLKSLKTSQSYEFKKINNLKNKISTWSKKEYEIQLGKGIIDLSKLETNYDDTEEIREDSILNKNKLLEIKREVKEL